LRFGLCDRLFQCRPFDDLSLAVQPIKLGCDATRFQTVGEGQQTRAESSVADPTPGVDSRAEREAKITGARPAIKSSDVDQRGESRTRSPCHHHQTFGDERPVETRQGSHVGDCRQRDKIE
jgi:hypothetical protein